MAHQTLKRCLSAVAVALIVAASLGRPALPVKAMPFQTLTPPITVTTRVSVADGGGNANNNSDSAAISSDGRYVAFASDATDLLPAGTDTNGVTDIFRRDLQTNTTIRVSVSTAGAQANDYSYNPSISGDGRYVVFTSDATNLVAGDNNGLSDIFIRDVTANTTTRVSVSCDNIDPNGWSDKPSISADGNYVAYHSNAYNLVGDPHGLPTPCRGDTTQNTVDVFVWNRNTNQTSLISVDNAGNQGNQWSNNPVISSDGRYVAFWSVATNLVPGGTTGGRTHIFFHDRDTDADGIFDEPGAISTVLVDKSTTGTEGNDLSQDPTISADGHHVAFISSATNLVNGDTNNQDDIFVRNTQTNITTRASVGPGGIQANLYSTSPTISSDGRYVAFSSDATNLVAGDINNNTDVFVRDTQSNTTTLVSVSATGVEADWAANNPSISSDGNYLVFNSFASTLVLGDTNDKDDIFMVPASGTLPASPGHPNGQVRITVGVSGNGFGYVTSTPAAITCGVTCLAWFDIGSNVTLTAHLNGPSETFMGWSGSCTGTSLTCTFNNIQAPQTVNAAFTGSIYLPLVVK